MVFSSSLFLTQFLPIFLLCYFLVGKRYKNIVILLASIYFYSWGAPTFIFILMGSTILDFFIVKKLHASEEQRTRNICLSLSLVMNVGLLLYFKYANFFIENVDSILLAMGMEQVSWTKVVLPIGISFYTFQTLTYSIDVYRRVHAPLKKLTDYLLHIMSFPQMIAGPIVRFNAIADEIIDREETMDLRLRGFFRFCLGLAKKVLIANVMGETANLIMDQSPELLSTSTAWVGIIAYSLQIYFDFSGYSDMAIGLGMMMGFHFPENFDNPYISKSISEFWRRWHITLGTWMRDYLYIPLGGNRVKSKVRLYFNLWFVFLVSGLWHGASWSFVFWGAFHGLFLIFDRLFLLKILEKIGRLPSVFFTYLVVLVGWVFFRIENISEASHYVTRLFVFDFSIENVALSTEFLFILSLALLLAFSNLTRLGEWLQNTLYYHKNGSSAWYIGMTVFTILLFILSLSSVTTEGFNPFIYFRF